MSRSRSTTRSWQSKAATSRSRSTPMCPTLRPRQPLRPPRIRSSRTIYRAGSHDHRSGVPDVAGHNPTESGEDRWHQRRRERRQTSHRGALGRRLQGAGDLHAAEPTDPGCLAPDRAHTPCRTVPRADAAVQPRLGRPVPARRPACPGEQEVGAGLQRGEGDRIEHDTAHVAKRRPNARGTLLGRGACAAGAWLVPQVRRRSPVGHPRCLPLHGDDLGDVCRCAHRVLRREVPLRVLEADHRDSRRSDGRQRRDRRRSRLEPAAPGRHRTIPNTRAPTRVSRRRVGSSSPSSSGRRRSTSRSRA